MLCAKYGAQLRSKYSAKKISGKLFWCRTQHVSRLTNFMIPMVLIACRLSSVPTKVSCWDPNCSTKWGAHWLNQIMAKFMSRQYYSKEPSAVSNHNLDTLQSTVFFSFLCIVQWCTKSKPYCVPSMVPDWGINAVPSIYLNSYPDAVLSAFSISGTDYVVPRDLTNRRPISLLDKISRCDTNGVLRDLPTWGIMHHVRCSASTPVKC